MVKSKIVAEIPEDIAKMTFEEAYREMEEITMILEEKNVALATTVTQYKRAQDLYKHCRNLLDKAKLEVEKIN